MVYPNMKEDLNNPRYMEALLGHLDVCKDVCDHFGITSTLVPYRSTHMGRTEIVGFTSKSFKSTDKNPEDDYDFAYDPFWDDGTDFDTLYANIDDDYEEQENANQTTAHNKKKQDVYPEIQDPVPDDDDVLIDTTKTWVSKIMSDMGICPFTRGSEKAGLPMGDVFYCVDRHEGVEDVYARFWKEVVRVEQHKEKDLSTTLLILPEFFLNNVELFETFSNTLTQSLTALKVEDLCQLIFFHPHWSFRDGNARSGEGLAANYARRSPWPMINILRTTQVRAAQKGIPTGLVYKQNEKTLSSIGVDQLETMLRLRDWSALTEEQKVNRREHDALKLAREFQDAGEVKVDDFSLSNDATPSANKVERHQVEQGDLVKVLKQALEKRLGRLEGQEQAGPQPLSGPETSVSSMAVDFLIQELDRIAESGASSLTPEPSPESPVGAQSDEPVMTEREKRMQAARQAMLDDLTGADEDPTMGGGEGMTDVLFGKGGIPDSSDENYSSGMDPNSFY